MEIQFNSVAIFSKIVIIILVCSIRKRKTDEEEFKNLT